MEKTFILDTSVILSDPQCIFKLGTNTIIIPAVVLEEVDGKKRQMDEVGRNARVFSRTMEGLIERYPVQINKGVPLENGATLRVELNHISSVALEKVFVEKTNDNRILSVAHNLKEEYEEEHKNENNMEFVLLSQDILVRVKADAMGILSQRFESGSVLDDLDTIHKGFHHVVVSNEVIQNFYSQKRISYNELLPFFTEEKQKEIFVQNFFVMKNEFNEKSTALGKLIQDGNEKFVVPLIMSDSSEWVYGIRPKNMEQLMALELLMDPYVKVVCIYGPAGTGKTLLALAAALEQIEDEQDYQKVLAARPVIPMGRDIGYLKGDMNEKLRPWMQPIYDNLEYLLQNRNGNGKKDTSKKKGKSESKENKDADKNNMDEIANKLNIQVEALTYIRGRSIPGQFFILDEAQNTTPHEVKTILTRIGEGSKIVLVGDPEQIDHPYLDSTNNGLTHVVERMKQESDVGVVGLSKTERSTLAEKAAKLL